VTPFVYRRPERFRLESLTCPFGNFSDVRVALDTREDHEHLVRLHALLPADYDYRDVLTAVELSR
jgi:spore coat polysaccharide biosynthesis protein SpsF (cytidylyltransferase family)